MRSGGWFPFAEPSYVLIPLQRTSLPGSSEVCGNTFVCYELCTEQGGR